MEWITTNTPVIVTAMGVIAFIVSIITEMTKEIGFLNKIPTILQVIVLSVTLWIVFYFGVCTSYSWFMLVAAIIAGFITAYISSYGWEKLNDVFKRYKKGE